AVVLRTRLRLRAIDELGLELADLLSRRCPPGGAKLALREVEDHGVAFLVELLWRDERADAELLDDIGNLRREDRARTEVAPFVDRDLEFVDPERRDRLSDVVRPGV